MQDKKPESVHILLVEDEPADAYLVRLALRENKTPVQLHHVPDGWEGLEFLRQSGNHSAAPRPDLILLDINMPRMNGHEFLGIIKSEDDLRDIPVVVLTTSELERDVCDSYRLGAVGFITKFMDLETFFSAMRQLEDDGFLLDRSPAEERR